MAEFLHIALVDIQDHMAMYSKLNVPQLTQKIYSRHQTKMFALTTIYHI